MLCIGTLVLLLGGIEAGLWILNIYPPLPRAYVGEFEDRESTNFITDPDVGWRMKPNERIEWEINGHRFDFLSNEKGFRCGDGSADVEKEKCIVVVGDSFMWGYGVAFEETCGHLLESGMENGKVHNLAMPGYGVDQMWLSLRKFGLPLKPDLVIVGLYTDDFERSFNAYRQLEFINKPLYRLDGDELVMQTPDDRPPWILELLEDHSRVFSFVWRFQRKLGFLFGAGPWWELNEAILEAIIADCELAGTKVLFVHFPYRDGRPFPALSKYMKKKGAEFIDFQAMWDGPRDDLYLENDVHINAAGHRFAADTLLKWVNDRLN
jgi:hypothetical protein